jgi:hypothetical protein
MKGQAVQIKNIFEEREAAGIELILKGAINKGILKCDRTEKGDETYTPFYAVEPVLKYIPADKTVWCPFDEEWSAYYCLMKERGYRVIRSSLSEGQDFFRYEPEAWDIIVSNPPFSKKDRVLERLYSFGKPFAILLPLMALQGQKRYRYLKNGVQILAFDRRVCYHRDTGEGACASGCAFPSAYFCHDFLPESLVLEELVRYERPLRGGIKDRYYKSL